uniref:Pentatricopeptide repeat-containing protein n=1 Tax=Rhizophora mucronata TaxID=61149 RepID=A0A2P2QA34_RHIMU
MSDPQNSYYIHFLTDNFHFLLYSSSSHVPIHSTDIIQVAESTCPSSINKFIKPLILLTLVAEPGFTVTKAMSHLPINLYFPGQRVASLSVILHPRHDATILQVELPQITLQQAMPQQESLIRMLYQFNLQID